MDETAHISGPWGPGFKTRGPDQCSECAPHRKLAE